MTTTIQEREVQTYTIVFPKSYSLKERIAELQKLNPDFKLSIEEENSLLVEESAFLLRDYGYFGIKLPNFTMQMFNELEELNEEIHFEFDDEEEIFIKMGIFAAIGLLTMAIGASIYNWARSKKMGNVYSDPTEYELDSPNNPNKKIRRIPDVSYISFESVPKETQKKWKGFIPHPPDLVIEIVSGKYGLKNDLKKMENVWMKTGVNVGLVICPFSEKIYIFEDIKTRRALSSTGYREQSLHVEFTHPLLPDYSENFGKYLEE